MEAVQPALPHTLVSQRAGALQEEIVREAQTMRQQAHPNVLALHCSFVHDRQLWMASPSPQGVVKDLESVFTLASSPQVKPASVSPAAAINGDQYRQASQGFLRVAGCYKTFHMSGSKSPHGRGEKGGEGGGNKVVDRQEELADGTRYKLLLGGWLHRH